MLAIKDEIITITMRAFICYGAIKTRKCVPQKHLKDMKYHDGELANLWRILNTLQGKNTHQPRKFKF